MCKSLLFEISVLGKLYYSQEIKSDVKQFHSMPNDFIQKGNGLRQLSWQEWVIDQSYHGLFLSYSGYCNGRRFYLAKGWCRPCIISA